MVICASITPLARLHVRCPQLWLRSTYIPQMHCLGKPVLLTPSILSSLTWWTNPSKVLASIPFTSPALHTSLTMDASLGG